MAPRLRALSIIAVLLAATAPSPAGPALAQIAASPPQPRAHQRYRVPLLRADSLAQAWRHQEALAILSPLIRDARRRGDRYSLATLLKAQASLYWRDGRQRQVVGPAREAVRLAMAAADTATTMSALRLLGPAPVEHDGLEEPAHDWLLRIALARRDRRFEGYARSLMAYDALEAGRLSDAKAGYQRAVDLLRRTGDWRAELNALTGLGRAYYGLGDLDRSRECHLRVAKISEERKDPWNLGYAYNNLGTLDFVQGDPGVAVEHYRQAWETHRAIGNIQGWLTPAINIAIAQKHMGQYRDAAATLDQALADADSAGLPDFRFWALAQLASVRNLEGHPREAAALCRQALADRHPIPINFRVDLTVGLAAALAKMDSTVAALAVLDREIEPRRKQVSALRGADVALARGEYLLRLGQPADALRTLLGANETGQGWRRIGLLSEAALCERALGRADSALALLQRATETWELERGVPKDPEWREQRGAEARSLRAAVAGLLLEYPPERSATERAGAAYDALQRFKARTLFERTLGPLPTAEELPARVVFRPVTAAELRQRVLAEGDLLIDASLGPEVSFLFAITPHELRVVKLPGDQVLDPRLWLFHDLLAVPPRAGTEGSAEWEPPARRLGQLLLGEVADLVRGARRIVLCPDGALNLVALGALELPERPEGPAEPLAATHDLAVVPSATLLAEFRRAGGAEPTWPTPVLALAGIELSGAVREARGLGRRYQGVEVHIAERTGTTLVPEDLARYRVLHLASHARADDQHPWRSGIRVGPLEDSERDPYLRAGRIAGMKLPARLVVLSSCETARGRIFSGEGVQGLSTAFLSAGVPAVVATLWPADDRATAALMAAFYAALARGEPAAAALRAAQAEVRKDPATHHPFYWAGFTLVGDGAVRVALRRRPAAAGPMAAGLGVLAICGLGLWLGRRRSSTGDRV